MVYGGPTRIENISTSIPQKLKLVKTIEHDSSSPRIGHRSHEVIWINDQFQ